MKRILLGAIFTFAFICMSATSWADTYTDHVSQAADGKGDLLIYPVYLAPDGFQTKLQVVNTARNVSAVAKVVIRSPYLSQETLDFFIFLTPTDVWEGFMKFENDETVVYSEDDSSLVDSTPTFATSENPMSRALENICDDDPNFYGYAEVMLAYVFPNDVQGMNLTSPLVDKQNVYDAFVGGGDLADPQPLTGLAGLPDNAQVNTNILAGNLQVQSPLLGMSSALQAVTLQDYRINDVENVIEPTVLGTVSNNNLMEVEAALAKNNIGLPYINDDEGNSLHFFTFPTKITRIDDECNIRAWTGNYNGFVGNNFDSTTNTWESVRVRYQTDMYDQEENKKTGTTPIFSPAPIEVDRFLYEVNFLAPDVENFDKGWIRYMLPNGPTADVNRSGQDLRYFGAPVIPMTMNFGESGFSTMYGFYDDGAVHGQDNQGNWENLPGYQYARATPGT